MTVEAEEFVRTEGAVVLSCRLDAIADAPDLGRINTPRTVATVAKAAMVSSTRQRLVFRRLWRNRVADRTARSSNALWLFTAIRAG